ncbi:MAG: cupin domain-containing protein [Chitinophagales bacterium]
MEATTKTPKVVSSKEGTKLNILGHEVTVKLHSWDGNDNYVFSMISPPGSGIPPHVHTKEDEMVYILEGQFEVMIGGEVFKATSGDCLNLVRNIPHGYTITGTSDAKTLWCVSPGKNFEEFFDELSLFPPGPPDIKKLNDLSEGHGITNLI